MTKKSTARQEPKSSSSTPPLEMVDPAWLLKAFLIMVLFALLCGYLTLCGLFYRGQWQLVLHPVRTSAVPSTEGGVAFQTVRFGAGSTGVPQMEGWWIPAVSGAAAAHLTILYLPGGDGSLADNQADLARLHDIGVAVFAIDYRGFGHSADLHPSEQSMAEDAEMAWVYLTGSRGIAREDVVPYGKGVGAALALGLAVKHTPIRALVLDTPEFDVEERVKRDPRSGFVPVRLLFHNRFALFPELGESRVPKLILNRDNREAPQAARAADPKTTVVLPASDDGRYAEAIRRFLDQYVASVQAPPLVSSPAPEPRKAP